jgi:hypothetical protein
VKRLLSIPPKHSEWFLAVCLAVSCLQACSPPPPSTPFIPPKAPPPTNALLPGETPLIPTFTPIPEATPSPSPTPPCTDGLTYIDDLTIPDGTIVLPGASLEKGWLVQNSGSCNWDARYRLKFVGGFEMGASEQTLYPARAGTQATLRISFTAPQEPGEYTTAWQAFGPDGEPFGDTIYMQIVVQ